MTGESAGRDEPTRAAASDSPRPLPALRRAALGAVAAAVLFAGVALIGALPYGYPDNGDFKKYNRSFVSGPAGPASPIPGTLEAWRESYSERGWHRYWTLRSDPGAPRPDPGSGTTNVLWLPGVAMHRVLRPGPTLDLLYVGILPRLLILAATAALAAAVAFDAYARGRAVLLLAVAPWPLALTASSMTAYFNTFYREAGTFTYAALFVSALALTPRLGRLAAAAAVLVAGAGLVATAPAHGPLAALVALAAWDVGRSRTPERSTGRARIAVLAVGTAGVLALGAWRMSTVDPQLRRANVFNSLFLGILPLSDAPDTHLERLGFPRDSRALIGRAAFGTESRRWRQLHGAKLEHRKLFGLLWNEPRLLPRIALRAAGLMNRTSIRDRNLYAEDGPRPWGAPGWNPWGELQRRVFPRGLAFLLFCPAAIAAGIAASRRRDIGHAATGRVVAVCAAAALIELALKFMADGPTEPTRHLVAANLFLGASLAALLWLGLQRLASGRPRTGRRAAS